jgi:hypothetical protein
MSASITKLHTNENEKMSQLDGYNRHGSNKHTSQIFLNTGSYMKLKTINEIIKEFYSFDDTQKKKFILRFLSLYSKHSKTVKLRVYNFVCRFLY